MQTEISKQKKDNVHLCNVPFSQLWLFFGEIISSVARFVRNGRVSSTLPSAVTISEVGQCH